MRHSLSAICVTAIAAAALLPAASQAVAQPAWPEAKPITIVQPFAAGADFMSRLLATAIEERVGQRVIVENRPGAAGGTGTAYVAKQPPDGYTLVMATPGPAANHLNTFPSLPYNPLEDFEHITRTNVANMALLARKDFPLNTLEEVIAYAKANPGKLAVGNNGVGSFGHRIALLLAEKTGVQFKYVPYRGTPAIVTDLIAETLDLSSDFYGSSYSNAVAAGMLKVIAIPSPERTKFLPDTPTFRESGIDIAVMSWQGIMAPKGTPRPIIDKLNEVIHEFLATEEAQQRLEAIAQIPAPTTPEEFRAIVVEEEALWRDIIKKHNIRAE